MAVFKKGKEESPQEPQNVTHVQEAPAPQAASPVPNPGGEYGDKLGIIRDIIFGQNMEDYNQQFNELKSLVDEKRNELDDYIRSVKADLQEKIQELDSMMKDQMNNLEGSFAARTSRLESDKMDRSKLGDLLVEIGNQIKS